MEYTQWGVHELEAGRVYQCLNPCSNGIYSMRLSNRAQRLTVSCLNPCSNGIYSMSLKWCDTSHSPLGLNPCSNGIYSMSRYSNGKSPHWGVLILVLMEYTQWVNKNHHNHFKTRVLILVLMEYTQWECLQRLQWGLSVSLNPCSNGIYSMRVGNDAYRGHVVRS